MAEPATRPATYADLEALPDTVVGEIIDGVLETHPRPAPPHTFAAAGLTGELAGPFQRGRGGPGGWLFSVEPEFHLGAHVLVPDVAGWRRSRLPSLPPEAFIEIEPDWVCEILSPSTARVDRGAKRRIYAETGVDFLWLLDPVARELEAFSLVGRRWMLVATVQEGELVQAPPFEVIAFPLNALFPFDHPAPPPATKA
ncbi:MAG: Uma2 family endonuclease [Methylobacteriaceae bacterium]|nr:Uma2 family endonuclease [Methylobacteriaceae bacterium]